MEMTYDIGDVIGLSILAIAVIGYISIKVAEKVHAWWRKLWR